LSKRRSIFRALVGVFILVTAVMWIRSYYRVDSIHWSDSQHFASLVSSGGRVNFTWTDWEKKTAWSGGWSFGSRQRIDPQRPHWETLQHDNGRRRFLGFEWSTGIHPMAESPTQVSFYLPLYSLYAVPYWAILVCVPGPVVLRTIFTETRRRRRIRQSLCPACGYDLRASSERCPECGTPRVARPDAARPAVAQT
jgi:hypothetical protein